MQENCNGNGFGISEKVKFDTKLHFFQPNFTEVLTNKKVFSIIHFSGEVYTLIKQISKHIFNFMSRHIKVEAELKDVYIYGIEITVSTALNVCLVMLAAVLLGSPLSGVSHLGCLFLLRSFCGGYHASSYFKCNSLMVIFFLLSHFSGKLLVYFNLTDSKLMSAFLMLAFLPIYAFAPVKNKYKTLSERKAKKCRILSIIIYIILSLLGLYLTFFGFLYGSIIIVTLIEISGSVLFEIYMQRRHNDENKGNGG